MSAKKIRAPSVSEEIAAVASAEHEMSGAAIQELEVASAGEVQAETELQSVVRTLHEREFAITPTLRRIMNAPTNVRFRGINE
jgi:hypothetical protein